MEELTDKQLEEQYNTLEAAIFILSHTYNANRSITDYMMSVLKVIQRERNIREDYRGGIRRD